MIKAISPIELASRLDEIWSPRVIAELDDNFIKVAKVKGTFGWHTHPAEDELFMIIKGSLRIETEQGSVQLNQGEMYVVPKGIRHTPVADEECLILLIEKKQTLHSGDTVNANTRSIDEQLRRLA